METIENNRQEAISALVDLLIDHAPPSVLKADLARARSHVTERYSYTFSIGMSLGDANRPDCSICARIRGAAEIKNDAGDRYEPLTFNFEVALESFAGSLGDATRHIGLYQRAIEYVDSVKTSMSQRFPNGIHKLIETAAEGKKREAALAEATLCRDLTAIVSENTRGLKVGNSKMLFGPCTFAAMIPEGASSVEKSIVIERRGSGHDRCLTVAVSKLADGTIRLSILRTR